MRLSQLLQYVDAELTKQAEIEEEETKEAMAKRDEAISIGRALANLDLGITEGVK